MFWIKQIVFSQVDIMRYYVNVCIGLRFRPFFQQMHWSKLSMIRRRMIGRLIEQRIGNRKFSDLIILTIQSIAITLRTTRFKIQNFYMVLNITFMCFVRSAQQAATFALHNISRLVLYNRSGECLLPGTHWVVTCNGHVWSLKGWLMGTIWKWTENRIKAKNARPFALWT